MSDEEAKELFERCHTVLLDHSQAAEEENKWFYGPDNDNVCYQYNQFKKPCPSAWDELRTAKALATLGTPTYTQMLVRCLTEVSFAGPVVSASEEPVRQHMKNSSFTAHASHFH